MPAPPTDIRALLAAAVQTHQSGRLEEAGALYRAILDSDAGQPDALHFLGVIEHQQGRNEAAVELIGRALAHNPRVAAFHNNLGNALKACGRLTEAARAYGRAIELRPDHVDALVSLGNVLGARGRVEEAIAAYRRALAIRPDGADARHNLARLLLEAGRPDEAVGAARQAVLLRPKHAGAQVTLGHALREMGESESARGCFAAALALDPDLGEAALAAALAQAPIFAQDAVQSDAVASRFDTALDALAAWSAAHPGSLGRAVGSSQPFYLAYRPADVTPLLCRHGDLVAGAAGACWSAQSSDLAPHPCRERVRLLVISGHVRRHPVWDMVLRGLIAHLDRRRFEIVLYHTGALVDAETAWARSRVDRFVQGPKAPEAWLRQAAEERPDVAFYPEVGMDAVVGLLAALRLAPLQIAGWGHPVTSGLPTMDLFMSGELLEGPGAERHYRERLIRLPGTGVCTEAQDSSPAAPAPGLAWRDPGRIPGVVRFTVCQQPIKLDPTDDALLARIVRGCAPCELWLAASARHPWAGARLQARLASALRALDLDPEAHLRTIPWLPPAEFDRCLDSMDVYLDCPAFSGYTTARQAIRRGLPLVTIEGRFLRQRLAAGLLRQIGSVEGIAADREGYLEIALRWGAESRNGARWSQRREALRASASRADGNRAAVAAFEQAVIAALAQRGP